MGQQLLKATKKGSVGEVEFLLLGMGADVNSTNSDGRTPLMLYAPLLSFVLFSNTNQLGWGANRAARKDIEMMNALLDCSPDLDSCCHLGCTAVHNAACYGAASLSSFCSQTPPICTLQYGFCDKDTLSPFHEHLVTG
jgi:hypothetical protein